MHMQISTERNNNNKKNWFSFTLDYCICMKCWYKHLEYEKKKKKHHLCGLIGRIDLTDVADPDKVIVSWQMLTKMYNDILLRKK